MSMRTLIEINHDYSHRVTDPECAPFFNRYLASGSRENAMELERFGLRVVGMRHHSDKFIISSDADGFPARYLPAPPDAIG